MNDTRTACQTCGSTLDAARSEGVCAICLLGDALEKSPGGSFGGHELIEELARGGMAVVYRARQLKPEREVALKTLRGASLDSPDALARFRNEAAAMAGLEHPAILPVFQFGEADGVPFFTMKLMRGGTLAERLGSYAGKWREIAELMASVAEAVQHAHQRAVLHRDLKPGNILFDEEGQAYVSDFGIAKLADELGSALTFTTSLLGTPFYVSPEVAHDARAATTASDVWGLGVILHELLAQRRPFGSESLPTLLRDIAEKDPPRLGTAVPRDLAVITVKALAKDPARRYASARKFAEDLRCWLEGRPIEARPVPLLERLWLWSKRRPELAVLSALAVVLAFFAVASLAWGLGRAREEAQRANAAREDSQRRLLEALIERAHASRGAQLSGWRERGLTALREAAALQDGLDVRSEAVAHLVGLDVETGVVLPLPADAVPSPAFDLFAAVTAGEACEVRFFDVAGQASGAAVSVVFPTKAGEAAREFESCFDAKAARLVVQENGGGLALIDVTARRVLRQWPEGTFGGFTDDGALFALLLNRDHAAVYHAGDGSDAGEVLGNKERQPLGWHLCRIQPGSDSALLALCIDKTIEIWNWRSPRKMNIRATDETLARIAWSGDWLAVPGREMFQITLWNLRTGRVRSLPTVDSRSQSLAFSSDGRLIAAASTQGSSASVWDTVTGQRMLKSSEVLPMAFSSDGQRFLQNDNGQMKLGALRQSKAVRTLDVSAQSQGLAFMDISPDGRWLLLNSRALSESRAKEDCLSVWEIGTRRLVLQTKDFSHLVPAFFHGDSIHIIGLKTESYGSTDATLCVETLTNKGGTLSLENTQEITPVDLRRCSGVDLSTDRRRIMLGGGADSLHFALTDASATPVRDIAQSWPPPLHSPDGRWYAESAADQLRVFAAETRRLAFEQAVSFRTSQGAPVAWSPDSRSLAVVSRRHEVTLLDAESGRVQAELIGPLQAPVTALRFTPDGRSLVLLRDAGVLEIWDLPTLAAELTALGMPWHLPAPVSPAPPGLTGPVKETTLRPLYPR